VLTATLRKRFGRFELAADLEVAAGSTLVLAGESGAGKTTVLRLLAGLDRPDAGRVVVDGEPWFDDAAGVALPARARAVGYVAQDYALFPHLSVRENVAFGPRAAGAGGRAAQRLADEVLARLGLADFATRRPAQLSGGQQQRVALARALVLRPRLLLLDEPLSALDLATRRAVRGELRQLLAELPCASVYVTHSPQEAMVFGDRITVLEGGRPTQTGPRDDLLRHPRSPYVAEFMGVNLFRGTVVGRTPGGLARIRAADGEIAAAESHATGGPYAHGDEVFVAVNPREITLYAAAPAGSAQNVFHGPVTELVPEPPFGDRVRVALGTRPPLVAEVTREAVNALGLREGLPVYAAFKATGVVSYE
jgi:molybdate transport system ATP-binding protein